MIVDRKRSLLGFSKLKTVFDDSPWISRHTNADCARNSYRTETVKLLVCLWPIPLVNRYGGWRRCAAISPSDRYLRQLYTLLAKSSRRMMGHSRHPRRWGSGRSRFVRQAGRGARAGFRDLAGHRFAGSYRLRPALKIFALILQTAASLPVSVTSTNPDSSVVGVWALRP